MGRTRRRPRSWLTNLKLDEVSLVDVGDNPGAVVVFAKNADDGAGDDDAGITEQEIDAIIEEVLAASITEELAEITAEEGTTKRREQMTTTPVLKTRGDVLAAATARARELMKQKPDELDDLAAARALVWREDRRLAELYEELPEAPPAVEEPPVQKGAGVLALVDREVAELRKMHPAMPESEARTKVWKMRPDLADQYEAAVMS